MKLEDLKPGTVLVTVFESDDHGGQILTERRYTVLRVDLVRPAPPPTAHVQNPQPQATVHLSRRAHGHDSTRSVTWRDMRSSYFIDGSEALAARRRKMLAEIAAGLEDDIHDLQEKLQRVRGAA